MIWLLALAAAVGYAFGSINPASLIARSRGVDLRLVGSGNPGATNAARAMGGRVGLLVGALDVLKGFLPAVVFAQFGPGAGEIAGFAAVLGHVTSPFLRGRGGKGVATVLGAVLGAQPLWAPFVLIGFGLGFALFRRVGIGAVAGAGVLIVAGLVNPEPSATCFGVGMGVLVLARHQRNLRDLWHRGD